MSPIADVTDATFTARQQRLRERVDTLADRIAAGEDVLSSVELEILIGFCQEYFLPVEAARVRRWMTP